MVDIDHPAMAKHAMGWGAMNGIVSAQLASRGFTGTPSILGLETYSDWVNDVGQEFVMVDGLIRKRKGYACCAWTHGAAEGARRLVQDHQVALDEVERVHIETFHEAVRLGTELPTSTEEAQFNMAWPVAGMMVDGEIGPAQTLEHRLTDPTIRALAKKLEVVESDELNALCDLFEEGDPRGHWASKVTLVLNDGTDLRTGLEDGGFRFPAPAWDESRMEEKFRWLVRDLLDEPRAERLIDVVWQYEAVPDVTELTRMLERR